MACQRADAVTRRRFKRKYRVRRSHPVDSSPTSVNEKRSRSRSFLWRRHEESEGYLEYLLHLSQINLPDPGGRRAYCPSSQVHPAYLCEPLPDSLSSRMRYLPSTVVRTHHRNSTVRKFPLTTDPASNGTFRYVSVADRRSCRSTAGMGTSKASPAYVRRNVAISCGATRSSRTGDSIAWRIC